MKKKNKLFYNLFPTDLTSSHGMRLNPITLSFKAPQKTLEKEFLYNYYTRSLFQFRFALILALIFYDLFAFLDSAVVPEADNVLWIVRFYIVTPVLLLAMGLSFAKSFHKYMQAIIMVAWGITGFGIIIMTHIVSGKGVYSYYAGLILIFIFGYTFIRARFINASIIGWLLVIIYEIDALWISPIPRDTFMINNFFFIGANIIGMFTNYSQELSFRRDFYLKKLLIAEQEKVTAANAALEKRVKERTVQLTSANIELNKEIEQRKLHEEERNKLEVQLLQLQKMETIGTLAGGIAHDFNNILTPILGYTEMAMEELEEDSNLMYDIEQIYNAAIRAKDLVQQILTFSRQVEVDKKPLQMHQVITEVMNLVKASFPSNIQIIQNLDPSCGTIMADATQIHQVIMNLSTNAYHAMMDSGGTLKISLKAIEANQAMVRKIPKLELKTYICTTIEDSGHGMDKQTLIRIFEPFFTKKEVGVGSGLGLSVVHGIINSYEGAITV
ncbi:MAG: ATP-binding protein, partial [Bacteroidota bacterium]|nr:ATP-binding protein [Bacteroidota bacterium]